MSGKDGFFWNVYAHDYDAVRLLEPYQNLLDNIVSLMELKQGMTILDVCCGSGNLSEKIAATEISNVRIEAFDASDEMLAMARQKLAGHTNIKIYRADMDSCFQQADGSFDVVVCSNALYASKDPVFLVGEMARVLRKGGRLVIANPFGVSRVALLGIFLEHFCGILEQRGLARALWSFAKDAISFAYLIRRNLKIIRDAEGGAFVFPDAAWLGKVLWKNGCNILSLQPSYVGTVMLIEAKKISTPEIKTDIIVKRVTTDEDLREVYRLRYDIYCEYLQSLEAKNYPDKMERDACDERSIHFAAYDNGRICGTLRLIPDGANGFLMEKVFGFPGDLDRGKALEISRIIGHRRFGCRVSSALLRAAREFSLQNGFTFWIGAWQEGVLRNMLNGGTKFLIFGDTLNYHNSTNTPAYLNLEDPGDL